MNGKINVLNSSRFLEYKRIFENADVDQLDTNYRGQIKFLQDISDTYDMYSGWAGGCSSWVTNNLVQFNNFYGDY
ncbi:MAG: hypothetical protein LBT10_00855 [Methanobrevibacter sp.]|jgi:hypothetical protein|nr:hypothetical protein [Methanobrevibacter sp.]